MSMSRSLATSLILLCGVSVALPLHANPTATASNRPMTAQQYIQQQHELRQQIKTQQLLTEKIETAHQTTLAQNQALQLANDNLSVQVKVLQAEQSAQMFLYGAATIVIGAILGFILGGMFYRRQRRW